MSFADITLSEDFSTLKNTESGNIFSDSRVKAENSSFSSLSGNSNVSRRELISKINSKLDKCASYLQSYELQLKKLAADIHIESSSERSLKLAEEKRIEIDRRMKEITQEEEMVPQVRPLYNRLQTDYKKLIRKHDQILQDHQKKQMQSLNGGNLVPLTNEKDQKHELIKLELDFNYDLIEEREKEIEKIHEQVNLVNQAFQDLATLVNDQQGTIDEIHDNVSNAKISAEKGLNEVRQAAENQRSCCIQ